MDKCWWEGKIKFSNKMKKIILLYCTIRNSAVQLTRTGELVTVVCIYDFQYSESSVKMHLFQLVNILLPTVRFDSDARGAPFPIRLRHAI